MSSTLRRLYHLTPSLCMQPARDRFEAMAKPHCAALTQEALIQALEGLLGLGDECLHADESSAAMEATQKLLKPHAAAIILGLQRVIQQQHTPAKRPSGAAQRMKVAPHKVLGLVLVCAGHHTQPLGQTVQAHLHPQSPCRSSACQPAGQACIVLFTRVNSTLGQDVLTGVGRYLHSCLRAPPMGQGQQTWQACMMYDLLTLETHWPAHRALCQPASSAALGWSSCGQIMCAASPVPNAQSQVTPVA